MTERTWSQSQDDATDPGAAIVLAQADEPRAWRRPARSIRPGPWTRPRRPWTPPRRLCCRATLI
jgi:hypothetical protein